MASPQFVNPIKPSDPVDALGVLVVDLRALADRLGLRESSRKLQQLLDSVEKRAFGPRTAIMLLGETATVKRRFLERILGPHLGAIPEPVGGYLRLEYGPEPECTVSLPQGLTAVMPLEQLPEFLARRDGEMPYHSRQTVSLPHPALAKALAIIDTPAADMLASASHGEDISWLPEAAAMADCWVLVLGVDHELSQHTLRIVRELPRPCDRLDIVIEGAESLSGPARQSAREELVEKLREHCGLKDIRLTLLASPAAEGQAGGFWNGRFATFQSVLLLRGREHWLHATRECVAEALGAMGAEIHDRLDGGDARVNPGSHQDENYGDLQKARLRLGERDLQGLQARFDELGLLAPVRPAPSLVSAVIWPESAKTEANAEADLPQSRAETQPPSTKLHSEERHPAALRAEDPPLSTNAAQDVAPRLRSGGAASRPVAPTARQDPPWRHGSAYGTGHHVPVSAGDRFLAARQTAVHALATVAKRISQQGAPSRPADSTDRPTSTDPHTAADANGGMEHSVALRGTPYVLAVRNLSAAVTLLFKHDDLLQDSPPVRRRRRVLAVAGMVAAAWLILWAVWLRQSSPRASSPWRSNDASQSAAGAADSDFEMPEFQSPVKEPAAPAARAVHASRSGSREVIADPSFTDLGLSHVAAASSSRLSAGKSVVPTGLPPTVPVASAHVAEAPAVPADPETARPHKLSRRGFRSLGKVWHWVRRGDPVTQQEPGPVNN